MSQNCKRSFKIKLNGLCVKEAVFITWLKQICFAVNSEHKIKDIYAKRINIKIIEIEIYMNFYYKNEEELIDIIGKQQKRTIFSFKMFLNYLMFLKTKYLILHVHLYRERLKFVIKTCYYLYFKYRITFQFCPKRNMLQHFIKNKFLSKCIISISLINQFFLTIKL